MRNVWRTARLLGSAGVAAALVATLAPGDSGAVTAEPAIVVDQGVFAQLVTDDAHCGVGGVGGSTPAGGCQHGHPEVGLDLPPAGSPDLPDPGPDPGDDLYDASADPALRSENEVMDSLTPDGFYEVSPTFRFVVGGTSTWAVVVKNPDGSVRKAVGKKVPARTGACGYVPNANTEAVYDSSRRWWASRADHHIYKYDHVPPLRAARNHRTDPGTWFHFLCGGQTPAGIVGRPAGPLSPVEGDYYHHAHWVYSSTIRDPGTMADLDDGLAGFYAAADELGQVQTSPAATSMVNLDTWVWSDPGAVDIGVGPINVHAQATGIVMSERAGVGRGDVQVYDSDPKTGGCAAGGQPWTRDARPSARDLCYLRFLNPTRAGQQYTFRFFVRWRVTVGGASVTAWTSQTRSFDVRETQVVVGGDEGR
jgi:hypothetical protein